MAVLDQFIVWLNNNSVADVLLPFVLIFTVVYAVLQKSKVLGEDSKKFNIVIAVVLGFAVIFPHVLGLYGRPSVVDIINRALPHISLIVVAIVMFLLLLGVFAKDVKFAGTGLSGWAVILSLAAVVIIFGNAAGWFGMPNFLRFLNDPAIQQLVVVILVFGLIIAFITSDGDEPDKKKKKGILESFGEVFNE